jgi:phospholipid/cholesterol/gamma-HCH transport system substrate-binding protein
LSAARGIALAALAMAVLLAGYLLLFRGGGGHEYTIVFQSAGQLVKDDDVQVGGRRIGSVRAIELTDDNRAAIKVTVEEPYAPLREGTQAVIRLTSLSGIANRYVALTLAPDSNKKLPDGATLTSTTSVVDLDQVFNTLDERTRGDLRTSSRASPRSTRAAARRPASRPSTSTRCCRPRAFSPTRSPRTRARSPASSSTLRRR